MLGTGQRDLSGRASESALTAASNVDGERVEVRTIASHRFVFEALLVKAVGSPESSTYRFNIFQKAKVPFRFAGLWPHRFLAKANEIDDKKDENKARPARPLPGW